MSGQQDAGVTVDNQSFRSRKVSRHVNRYDEGALPEEENQFLSSYGNQSNFYTLQQSKVTEKDRSPRRHNTIIDDLTEKNRILKVEVERVEKILNVGDHRRVVRLPEINEGVLKKELENAYKQIKIYEHEVNWRQGMFEHEGTYVESIRKQERELHDRQDIARRLHAEISEAKKQSNEYTKLLTDQNIRKEYATKSSKLHHEIKYYQKLVADEEQKEATDQKNMDQKRQKIKETQQKLLGFGHSKKSLSVMRDMILHDKKGVGANSRATSPGENRGKGAYQNAKKEVNLLIKMQTDHAKKMQSLDTEKAEAAQKNGESKQRLEELEAEYAQVEAMFVDMKKKIDPNKLRPLLRSGKNPWDSTVSNTIFTGKGQNPLEHSFPTVEAGQLKKKAVIANDRLVIGAKSAKVVELTLYQNRVQFLGYMATYQIGDIRKKGTNNVLKRQNERFLKERTVKLEPGDWFSTFQCTINPENVIVGLIAASFRGKVIKAGIMQGFKKSLEVSGKEYPCCLYGCYSDRGWEMFGIERVESQNELE